MIELTTYDTQLAEIDRLTQVIADLKSRPQLTGQEERQLTANVTALRMANAELPPWSSMTVGAAPPPKQSSCRNFLMGLAVVLAFLGSAATVILAVLWLANQLIDAAASMANLQYGAWRR